MTTITCTFTYCTVFHRLAPSCVRNVTNDDDVSTMAHCDVRVEGYSRHNAFLFFENKLHEVYKTRQETGIRRI